MSKHKLPAVRHALQTLRRAGGGPLTMDEVAALEACAGSQAELLEALKDVFSLMDEEFLVRDVSRDSDPLWALNSIRFVTRLKQAHSAIAKAEGRES